MSKHQELCCGCKYDYFDEESWTPTQCYKCKYEQGWVNPSEYTDKCTKLEKENEELKEEIKEGKNV